MKIALSYVASLVGVIAAYVAIVAAVMVLLTPGFTRILVILIFSVVFIAVMSSIRLILRRL